MGTAWTNALIGGSPADAGEASVYYKRLGRYAAGFSLVSEAAIFTLGGALKRREMLSARLGDVLAELYLLSAVLKRWQHEGRHDADLPLVQCCLEQGFVTIERRLDEVLLNFPSRALSFFLRAQIGRAHVGT